MIRAEMKRAMASLDAVMYAAGFRAVKVVCSTEAEMKEAMKQYGYQYLIGGYTYESINTLGQKEKGVKINKVNGAFVAKFMTVVK